MEKFTGVNELCMCPSPFCTRYDNVSHNKILFKIDSPHIFVHAVFPKCDSYAAFGMLCSSLDIINVVPILRIAFELPTWDCSLLRRGDDLDQRALPVDMWQKCEIGHQADV